MGAVPGAAANVALAGIVIPVAVVQCPRHALGGRAAGNEGIGDEVIAFQQRTGLEVRVRRQDAGIDHGHDHTLTLAGFPGGRGIDATWGGLQVPLVLGEVLVVRGCRRTHHFVDFGKFHRRIGTQRADQRLQLGAARTATDSEQVRAHGQLATMLEAGRLQGGTAGAAGRLAEHARLAGAGGGSGGVVLVAHDDAGRCGACSSGHSGCVTAYRQRCGGGRGHAQRCQHGHRGGAGQQVLVDGNLLAHCVLLSKGRW